jgi:hypothetical protein
VLALTTFFVTLSVIRMIGHNFKEVAMNTKSEKSKNSKSSTSIVKRCFNYLTVYHIFDTVWAVGVSVMATVVSPLLLIKRDRLIRSLFLFAV